MFRKIYLPFILLIFICINPAQSQTSACPALFKNLSKILELNKREIFFKKPDGSVVKINYQYDSFDPKIEKTLIILPELDGAISTYDAAMNIEKMKQLKGKYNIIRLELIGQGKTLDNDPTPPKNLLSIKVQVDLLNDFLHQLDIKKADILGFSYSTGVATTFAAKHPEKVSNLILTAPLFGPIMSDAKLESIYAWLAKKNRLENSTRTEWTQQATDALAALIRDLVFGEHNIKEYYQSAINNQVPIHLIQPSKDKLIPKEHTEALIKLLKDNHNDDIQMVETGHKPPRENPEAFVNALFTILNSR